MIISCSEDATLQIFLLSDIVAGSSQFKSEMGKQNEFSEIRARNSLIGHSESVEDFALNRNCVGKLFSTGIDKTIIIWDLAKGNKLDVIVVESEVNCCILDLTEEFLYVGCADCKIYKVMVNF
jgi:WD40 repeat protein